MPVNLCQTSSPTAPKSVLTPSCVLESCGPPNYCLHQTVNFSMCAAKGPKPSTWRRTWTPARRDPTSTRHPARQTVRQTGATETEVSLSQYRSPSNLHGCTNIQSARLTVAQEHVEIICRGMRRSCVLVCK